MKNYNFSKNNNKHNNVSVKTGRSTIIFRKNNNKPNKISESITNLII